jgi:hypothetical protein
MHVLSSARLTAAGLLAAVLGAASPALAQSPDAPRPVAVEDSAELKREFDALFQETLRQPGNVDVALRYAAAATRLGDYEAAITALQRILFFNPSLDPARLELGVLYYRLGSYGAAREYLEQARTGGNLTEEQRARVDDYLQRVAALDTRHRFAGQVIAGFQHQTNANLGPASPDIRAGGGTAVLSDQFVKKADQNLFATGSAVYSYDLQDQDQSAIEVTGVAYASRYFRVHRLDLDYFEATVGPRTTLGRFGLEGFSVRPYAILNYVLLGEDPFYHSYGAGLDTSKALTPDLVARVVYEHRERNFEDSPDRATSRLLTGHTDGGTVGLQYALADNQRLTGTLAMVREAGRTPFTSDLQYGGLVTWEVAYAGPVGSLPWLTALSVGRLWYQYDAPDPFVDPDVTRFDRRWRLTATQNVPITERIGIFFELQRDVVSSTLPNFAYSNVSVVLGPKFLF